MSLRNHVRRLTSLVFSSVKRKRPYAPVRRAAFRTVEALEGRRYLSTDADIAELQYAWTHMSSAFRAGLLQAEQEAPAGAQALAAYLQQFGLSLPTATDSQVSTLQPALSATSTHHKPAGHGRKPAVHQLRKPAAHPRKPARRPLAQAIRTHQGHRPVTITVQHADSPAVPPTVIMQPATTPQTPLGSASNTMASDWYGFKFTTQASVVSVGQLGRWTAPGAHNGIHIVSLVDAATSTDVPGGSVVFSTSTASPGQYFYANLSKPILLQPKHSYYLMSKESSGGDPWYNNTSLTSIPGIQINNPETSSDGTNYSDGPTGANTYSLVNFTLTPFNYSVSPTQLTFGFSEPVTASPWPSALSVINLNTGDSVTASSAVVNSTMPGVTFSLGTGLPKNGNYLAVLHGSQIKDGSNDALVGSDGVQGHDFIYQDSSPLGFWYQAGDANRDRKVGSIDIVALLNNYGATNATYTQGDFNGDGQVGSDDIVTLLNNFGAALSAPFSAPGTPSVVRAGSGALLISWSASSDPSASAYDVYRNSQRIAANISVTSFLDSGLASNTAYNYMIVAKDSSGDCSYASAELYAKTNPTATEVVAPPTNVTAGGQGSTSLTVQWTPSTTPNVTYSIYLGTTPTFPLNSQSLVVSGLPSYTNQYTITGLDPTATYYAVVVAVLPDGTSSDPSAGAANGGNPTTIGADPGSTPTSNPDPSSPGVTSSGDVPPNDDSYSPQVDLGFQINFYGRKYAQVFVNNNGNLTFDYALAQYTPQDITQLSYPMVAPFWGDVDTRTDVNPNTGDSGCGTVTYHPTTVGGRRAFEADWTGTGYYDRHSNLKNTFSVQIVNRDDINIGDFDIVFNYYQLQWETGDASMGTNGMGGTPAYAGWTNGSLLQGDSYQLAGSGVSGGLIGMTGRKVYQVRNVDLALDSDNNEDTKAPEHNAAEEHLQDLDGKPGKVVTVNDGDANNNGVPDYADGYNLGGSAASGTAGDSFVPVLLTAPNDFDFSKGTVTFTYDASDPMGVTTGTDADGNPTYTLPGGHLRLWMKDGTQARNGWWT